MHVLPLGAGVSIRLYCSVVLTVCHMNASPNQLANTRGAVHRRDNFPELLPLDVGAVVAGFVGGAYVTNVSDAPDVTG